MKILIISRNMGALQSPVISVRIIEYLEYLKDEGYLEYAAISENDSTAIQMLSWADCIVFNKHFSDNAYCIALLAKEKKIKIIYDIDDQIFAWPESHKSLYIRDQKSFLRFIEIADVLTVENIRIYNELKLLKRDMVVIPNGIYTEKYKQPDLSARKNKQYIFSAYAHKITHFETSFLNVLRNFYTSHKDMRLVFYGDSLYHIMQLPFVRHVPMSNYRDYMDSIIQSKSLFAVTPLGGSEDLIDIRFNICKSPIKYIMYGFSGTPCIFSDVLPYKKYVINEQTGLLVKNNYEAWRDALERMVKDVDLHRKIQKNAYEDICNNYHIKKTAGVYLKDVLGIISH